MWLVVVVRCLLRQLDRASSAKTCARATAITPATFLVRPLVATWLSCKQAGKTIQVSYTEVYSQKITYLGQWVGASLPPELHLALELQLLCTVYSQISVSACQWDYAKMFAYRVCLLKERSLKEFPPYLCEILVACCAHGRSQ